MMRIYRNEQQHQRATGDPISFCTKNVQAKVGQISNRSLLIPWQTVFWNFFSKVHGINTAKWKHTYSTLCERCKQFVSKCPSFTLQKTIDIANIEIECMKQPPIINLKKNFHICSLCTFTGAKNCTVLQLRSGNINRILQI